jgi:L-alanine-DL-glutamate epimerase-like enolase superfamily enzyme
MGTSNLEFAAEEQVWPLDRPFRISRGVRTEARVLVVTISEGDVVGRGEAVPSRRYGESVASAIAQLEPIFAKFSKGVDRPKIQKLLPAGAARNALDCALWDLEAKRSGKRVWELANIPVIDQVTTAFTISLDTPEKMTQNVRAHREAPILKLKLGGDDLDLARVESVRRSAPDARILIDANEAWSPSHYREIVPKLVRLGVALIEQPFPAKEDDALKLLDRPIPVCADESCHTTADLPRLKKLYQAINVKLDKTGGLTEALRLTEAARENGFKILFGCMVCTSLGIAPSRILARATDYVDLDGPLLVARDRSPGLCYDHGSVSLPSRELWG